MRDDGQRFPGAERTCRCCPPTTCARIIIASARSLRRTCTLPDAMRGWRRRDDLARRSGPWPSGRTWYLASRLLAAIEAVSPGNRVAAERRARRPGRRSGAALSRVPRNAQPARSGGHPQDPAQPGAAGPHRSRVCRVLLARRRGPEQQDAGAMAGRDDRARRREPARTPTFRPPPRARSATSVIGPKASTRLPEECRPFYELMQLAKLVPTRLNHAEPPGGVDSRSRATAAMATRARCRPRACARRINAPTSRRRSSIWFPSRPI